MKWLNLHKNPIRREGLYLFSAIGGIHTPRELLNIIFLNNIREEIFLKREFWIGINPYTGSDEKVNLLNHGLELIHCEEAFYPVFHRIDISYTLIPLNDFHINCIDINSFKIEPISTKKRHEVYSRDKYKCRFCGNSPAIDSKSKLTIDHIHPVSMGGSSHINNLQTLCNLCNSRKNNIIMNIKDIENEKSIHMPHAR
jgi:hypothetical protein